MTIDIVSTGEASPYLKACIYGASGVGKTTLAATAPKPLIVDIERGTLSIRHMKEPKITHIETWEDLREVLHYLRKEEHDFETIVIDSMHEAQQMSIAHSLSQGLVKNPTRDRYLVEQGDWGKSGVMMREMIKAFKDLPMHFIVTCLDKVNDTGHIAPSLQGQPGRTIAAYFDLVGYLYVITESDKEDEEKEDEKEEAVTIRRLLIQPYENIMAKSRSGELGLFIDKPNIHRIIKDLKLMGSGDEEDSKKPARVGKKS